MPRHLRHFLAVLLASVFLAGTLGCAKNNGSLEAAFKNELDALRSEFGFPGAVAAYALADGSVHTVSSGLADTEAQRPMSPRDRMLAASIGKTFVAATVLALASDGTLDLDQPVADWLGDRPWFERLPNHRQITARHLLTHSSGLANHVSEPAFEEAFARAYTDPETPFVPEVLISYVLDRPPLFDAGQDNAYTDTGYILLGLLIEEITGSDYYAELQRRFLAPLGLSLTSPSNQMNLDGLVPGYMNVDNSFRLPARTTTAQGAMAWNPAVEWTGGGLISNAGDLARWGKALFEGSAMDSPYLPDLLRSVPPHTDETDQWLGAGVGVAENTPFGRRLGHGGWIPGYVSSLRYYPALEVAIAFQINTDIGVIDDSTTLFEDMEQRLAAVVASHVR